MIQQIAPLSTNSFYEADETAWLELMGDLIRRGRFNELDYVHLADYLEDMAQRDRREVKSRLSVLIAHLLKWDYQKKRRSRSWRATITVQRQELQDLLDSKALRKHARRILAESYAAAVERAAVDTGLSAKIFPKECPYTLEKILSRVFIEREE
jgi:hypothetical protein